ncbi:hypothetical protein T439DRAFT_383773 [Meredithblackwellia eburnea MCA 4105]
MFKPARWGAVFALWSTVAPLVDAHGYIKQWTVNGVTSPAQKVPLSSSAFRPSPNNTGFVGDLYATSKAITCGSYITPFNTTQAPGPPWFSDPDQAGGFTLNTPAGKQVQLVVSGNPGKGWPHPNGNLAAYLGMCGTGPTDCQNYDANLASWFKIKSELNGIPNTLIPAYDPVVDGNRYNITLPYQIPTGSYILRFEILAFDQASAAESDQVEIYPFCGQLYITSKTTASIQSLNYRTITFPSGYTGETFNATSSPGPPVIPDSAFSAVQTSSGSKFSKGAIAGVAAGGAVLLLLAILLFLKFGRRRNPRSGNSTPTLGDKPNPPAYGDYSAVNVVQPTPTTASSKTGYPPPAPIASPLSPTSNISDSVQHRSNEELWGDEERDHYPAPLPLSHDFNHQVHSSQTSPGGSIAQSNSPRPMSMVSDSVNSVQHRNG